MDRYLQRYFLDVPEEPVERMVREFLEQNHFKPSEWEGEPCWEVTLPEGENGCFFQYKYEIRVLEVQAWLRGRKNEELGLTGYEARRLKLSYLELIEGLYERLFTLIPQDSPLYAIDRDTLAEDRRLRRIQPFILPGVILALLFIVFVLPKII